MSIKKKIFFFFYFIIYEIISCFSGLTLSRNSPNIEKPGTKTVKEPYDKIKNNNTSPEIGNPYKVNLAHRI